MIEISLRKYGHQSDKNKRINVLRENDRKRILTGT